MSGMDDTTLQTLPNEGQPTQNEDSMLQSVDDQGESAISSLLASDHSVVLPLDLSTNFMGPHKNEDPSSPTSLTRERDRESSGWDEQESDGPNNTRDEVTDLEDLTTQFSILFTTSPAPMEDVASSTVASDIDDHPDRRLASTTARNELVHGEDTQVEPERDMCAICREEDVPVDELISLPCKHRYHQSCIASWCETPEGSRCPYCRHSLVYAVCNHRVDFQGSGPGTVMDEDEFGGVCRPCAPTPLVQAYKRRHPLGRYRRWLRAGTREDSAWSWSRWRLLRLAEASQPGGGGPPTTGDEDPRGRPAETPALGLESDTLFWAADRAGTERAARYARVAAAVLADLVSALRELVALEDEDDLVARDGADAWDGALWYACWYVTDFYSLPEVKAIAQA